MTATTATKTTTAKAKGGHRPPKKQDAPPLSRRQRLKQVNQTQKWPQQPRLTSPEARAKAYVRVSGLDPKINNNNNNNNTKADHQYDWHGPELRFGRLLASPHVRTRHAAVWQLREYLKARCRLEPGDDDDSGGENGGENGGDGGDHNNNDNTAGPGLSELDLLKLWKGLWHCLYLCDQVPVQTELSRHLANLIWCLAGTEQEDEYAAQAYLNLYNSNNNGNGSDTEDEEEEEEGEEMDEADDGDDDDSDVVIQGIVHGGQEEEDDDDDNQNTPHNNTQDDIDNDDDPQVTTSDDDDDDDTAEMKHCRGAHLAALFVSTFLTTVRREWGRMDRYRMDKFYQLIRHVMHQVYRYMAVRHWNLGIVRLFNDAIYDHVLSQTDCNGLRYHLIDVSLHELASAAAAATNTDHSNSDNGPSAGAASASAAAAGVCLPLTEATFIDCMEPYLAMAQTGGIGPRGDPVVQSKIVENILLKFLHEYSVLSDTAVAMVDRRMTETNNDNDDDDETKNDNDDDNANFDFPILHQVHVGTLARFIFDLASDTATKDEYRKSLYDVHKQFARRLKERGDEYDVVLEQHPQDVMELQMMMQQQEQEQEEEGNEEEERREEEAQVERDTNHAMEEEQEQEEMENDQSSPKKEDDAVEDKNATKKDKKKKKKKKKKKDKSPSKGDASEDDTETTDKAPASSEKQQQDSEKVNVETSPEEKERKSKKRKRKKRKSTEEESPTSKRRTDEEEDKHGANKNKATTADEEKDIVVTITTREQQHAKMSRKKAKKDKPSLPNDNDDAISPTKRVKFGNVNRARSYKASMKALRTANPKTPAASPEQSILRRKQRNKQKTAAPNKRKKAADYF